MESIERFESDLLHVAGKKDNIGRAVGEGLADRRVQARRIRMGATRGVVGRNASSASALQCSGLLVVADNLPDLQRGALVGREDCDPHMESIPPLSAERSG